MNSYGLVRPTLLLVFLLSLVAACASPISDQPASDGTPQLKIVTSFYPLQFIAERVAGQHGNVTVLTQPGAEPHDLELTPRQVASLSTADLIIYEKSFQPAVDEAVRQSGTTKVFETSTVVPLQGLAAEPSPGTPSEPAAQPAPGALDPHVWLDPTNVSRLATALADKLVALDPTNAADYARNADSLKSELNKLDEQFRLGLAHCTRTEFITQHAAFGYLARRYHLTQIGISGLSPDTEPSPARIAEVQRDARARGLTTIFYETLVSPAVAQAVAGDVGLKTAVLDPVEGITKESQGQDYVAVMKANLAALRTANGCP